MTKTDTSFLFLLPLILILFNSCRIQTTTLTHPAGMSLDEYKELRDEKSAVGNAGKEGSYPTNSPVSRYGKLMVVNQQLCDEKGRPVQLRGLFLRALKDESKFINEGAFMWLAEEWNIDLIRIPYMSASWYSEPSYIGKPQYEEYIDQAVKLCEKTGMYCIIDWHILGDGNPFLHAQESRDFFNRMAWKYGAKKHVIYELCNEPNGSYVTWNNVIKPYAEFVIPVIRARDPKSLIITGTGCWSQNIHIAAANPLAYKNILYTFHFYSGTHKDNLRKRVRETSQKLALISTEWGNSDCYAKGGPYIEESDKWLDLMEKEKISWCHYALTDFNEGAAILRHGVSPQGGWDTGDLTESGKYIIGHLTGKR